MRSRWLLVVVAMALAVAACSGDSESSGVASLDDSPSETLITDGSETATDVDDQEALNEFAACMRENGVEDFEDPIVDADGTVEFGFVVEGEVGDGDRDAMRTAMEACREHLEGISLGRGDGGFDETEIQDQLVEFAACMREQGIDMDDPDLSSFGTGGEPGAGGPFGDLDFQDADVQAAMEICQGEFAFGPGGGAGGGAGGGRPEGGGAGDGGTRPEPGA